MLMRIFKGTGPVVLVGVFVIGWGFGLYYLFKTKNWDALTRPLPLAICALVVLQVALSTIGSSGVFQSLLGIVAVAVLLVGTVLPALSGVLLWIGRQSPARMWAAEQLARGRLFVPGVSASLVDGVSGGAVMAAVVRACRLGRAAGPRLRALDLARAQRRRCQLRLDDRRNAQRLGLHRPRRGICRRGVRSIPGQPDRVDDRRVDRRRH